MSAKNIDDCRKLTKEKILVVLGTVCAMDLTIEQRKKAYAPMEENICNVNQPMEENICNVNQACCLHDAELSFVDGLSMAMKFQWEENLMSVKLNEEERINAAFQVILDSLGNDLEETPQDDQNFSLPGKMCDMWVGKMCSIRKEKYEKLFGSNVDVYQTTEWIIVTGWQDENYNAIAYQNVDDASWRDLMKYIPSTNEPVYPELEPLQALQVHLQLKQFIGDIDPGPQPVAFQLIHVNNVCATNKYWFSQKCDGTRWLLVQWENPNKTLQSAFKGRNNNASTRTNMPIIPFMGKCVLDGELVLDLTSNKIVYVVFDYYYLKGKKPNVNFKDRQEALHALSGQIEKEQTLESLRIIIKEWVRPADILKISSNMKDGIFSDDKKNRHYSDGFVMQPEEEGPVLKFKDISQLSLDFRIHMPHLTSDYTVSYDNAGQMGSIKDMTPQVAWNWHDKSRLRRRYDSGVSVGFAEFFYRSGKWIPMFPRTEKDHPNGAVTVNSTLQALQDHLEFDMFVLKILDGTAVIEDPKHESYEERFKFLKRKLPMLDSY